MTPAKRLLQLPVFERLKDWYEIGPVQKATLDEFVCQIVKECVLQTTDVESLDRIVKHFEESLDEMH